MMQDDERLNKTEAAYRLLRRDILSTRLMPGSPLKLSALREAYGLGWTPLREALARLEAERLVTAISNRGFTVAPVSREALEDLSHARLTIEVPLLLEAIQKGGSDWEAAVLTAHFRLSRCRIAPDDPSEDAVDEWDEKHEAFHQALISAATSSWLLRFWSTLYDQLRRHHRFLELSPALRAATGMKHGREAAIVALRDAMAIEHHTALMEAALDRDAGRARALMIEHIGHSINVFSHAQDNGAGQAAPAVRNRKMADAK